MENDSQSFIQAFIAMMFFATALMALILEGEVQT